MGNYLHVIGRLYDLNDDPNQGYTETELLLAEQKLHCKLPEALRQYYKITGKNKAINATHNLLLAPDELYFANGHLVFYEENQAVAIWGIHRNEVLMPNPPVYGCYDSELEEWFQDSDTIENFLLSMAYLNAALGGLKYTAMKEQPFPETISFIENNWKEQTGITNQSLRFFTNNYTEIIVLTMNEEKQEDGLYVASNSKEAYQYIINNMNILWDNRTD